MNEENFNSNDKEYIIYEYVLKHPRCDYTELRKNLTEKPNKRIDSKTLRFYLYGNPDNIAFKNMIERGYLTCHSTRDHGEKKDLPDIFTINEDRINMFPKLKDKFERITLKQDIKIRANKLEKNLFENILKNIKISHKLHPELNDKIFLGDQAHFLLQMLSISLIRDVYLMNSDLWDLFQKDPTEFYENYKKIFEEDYPESKKKGFYEFYEDLKLELKIEYDIKEFFPLFNDLRNQYIMLRKIPQFPFKNKDFEIKYKDNEILLDDSLELDKLMEQIYKNAVAEQTLRERTKK